MSIDWWTLALQTVNFLLLVWLLRHFLYKPVRAVIAKRRALAEQTLAKAEAAEQAARASKADYEAKAAAVERGREAAIKQARAEEEKEAKTILAQAKAESENLLAEARKAAQENEAEALGKLKQEIADAAVDIAQTILGKTAEGDLNSIFLSLLLKKIENLGASERARLDADVVQGNGKLEIATSAPLSRAEQADWTTKLGAKLHLKTKPHFITEPDLIGGAELRFPHATVRFAWSDQLASARDLLVQDGGKA